MKLMGCTFTGVDERTNIDKLVQLSSDYPIVEWGFLYTPKLQGEPGRYPSIQFLKDHLSSLPAHVRVALHVCGRAVFELLEREAVVLELVTLVKARGGRIQLNFNQNRKPVDLEKVQDLLRDLAPMTIITQHNDANSDVWSSLREHANHAALFDASGGRGVSPDHWPAPLPINCGYAGGLGPLNIKQQVMAVQDAVGDRTVWIDMEGSLREIDDAGHDWLALDRCEACLVALNEIKDALHE